MTPFIETSGEELSIDDMDARGRSALRLADRQAFGSAPRLALHDGGDVRPLAVWDLHFVDEACRRLRRSAGIVHFHTGWPGMSTLRLGRTHRYCDFRCRGPFGQESSQVERSADQVQASIMAYATALDPRWTIVLTRVFNEIPDPDALFASLIATRRQGGGVVITAMGSSSSPFVFDAGVRLGLPDWDMVRRWSEHTPALLSALETTSLSEQWPQHILFGVAFSS